MRCSIQNLSFTYDGSSEAVFPGWSVELDTGWRLGLTGRNGRGKTTLLRLMMGELPHGGQISLPMQPVYFPYPVSDPEDMTLNVMQEAAGGEPEWKLLKELRLLEVTEDALYRPFSTLSRGEQTKALLCALFAREDAYPLIDEPTNHLDLLGRQAVAAYLRRKDGFLLVSHDRAFLNDCVDHILSINKTGFQVIQGNYDTWEEQFDRQNAYELKRNEDLKKEIGRLNQSARQAAQFAQKAEKDKFHVPESVQPAVDRGYAGARSAAMMKRAKAAVQRRERAAEEKSGLLHNLERVGELKLRNLHHPKQELMTVEKGAVRYDGREVCRDVHFTLRQGERLALTGPNGCGKSSILKTAGRRGQRAARGCPSGLGTGDLLCAAGHRRSIRRAGGGHYRPRRGRNAGQGHSAEHGFLPGAIRHRHAKLQSGAKKEGAAGFEPCNTRPCIHLGRAAELHRRSQPTADRRADSGFLPHAAVGGA